MSLKPWQRYPIAVVNLGVENDNYWLAEIPQLDGCKAYGRTAQEALEALGGVAEAFLDLATADNKALPMPLTSVPRGRYSGRFVVRVSPSLHKSLAMRAKAEGVSLNHLCCELLAAGIGDRSVVQTPAGDCTKPVPERATRNQGPTSP